MKVHELQEQLSKLDPQLDVICCCEDEKLLSEDRGFVLLDVSTIKKTEAERLRLDDGTPYLRFSKRPDASTIVILDVTTDF